jgi:KipI family sensor histidine kinase inhibitor
MKPKIVPLGDSALLVQLGTDIDRAINQRVHALATLINSAPIEGIIETVPAYGTLVIHYDPLVLDYSKVNRWVRSRLEQVQDSEPPISRRIEVPVKYGGEYGPDLESVAAYHHLQIEDVIRIHTERIYTVYMMGFTPGFPYMGKLDDAIVMPRLEVPRTNVPGGTVAIAGSQTGIYPMTSPGGWHLIGHTSLVLFDPTADNPFLFAPGDEVKFILEGECH